MLPHGTTPLWIPGLRDPAMGTPCVWTPPWIGIAQLTILLALSLQKGVLQLDAYQTPGHSGWTSTGFLAFHGC